MRHTINLFIALSAFWLFNSGHYTPLLLLLGVISIAFILCIVNKMNGVDKEIQAMPLSPQFPRYLIWLAKEIVLSNICVVKHIWLGNGHISPTLRTINASQKTDMGRVIYASSITLTPGTVAVDMIDNKILVHALLRENIDTLEAGAMDHRVSRLEESC